MESSAAGHGGKGVWPFAMVNNNQCGKVEVSQFLDQFFFSYTV